MTMAHPAHPSIEDNDHPHACYEGVVYIGHLVETPVPAKR